MKKGKNDRHSPPFVRLEKRLLFQVEEWKSLTARAKVLYLYLKAAYTGSNNGEIKLYYSSLKNVRGFQSHETISAAFKELEQNGWIRKTEIGGLLRHSNKYELTGRFDGLV